MLTHPQVTVGTYFPWKEAKRAVLPLSDPRPLAFVSVFRAIHFHPQTRLRDLSEFIEPSFAGREL